MKRTYPPMICLSILILTDRLCQHNKMKLHHFFTKSFPFLRTEILAKVLSYLTKVIKFIRPPAPVLHILQTFIAFPCTCVLILLFK